MKKYLFLLFISSFLVACGPVMKEDVTYTPPTTKKGKQCVEQCNQWFATCQPLCDQQYRECADRVKQERQNVDLPIAEKRYYALKEHCKTIPKKKRKDDPDCAYIVKPTLDENVDGKCSADCNCVPQYDHCYESCGGQITRKQVCVSNCK